MNPPAPIVRMYADDFALLLMGVFVAGILFMIVVGWYYGSGD